MTPHAETARGSRGKARSFHPALAIRLAWRSLLRSPGTTSVAVGVLTLGLAAPAIFFSLLAGALRPLPVPHGDRVIKLEVRQPSLDGAPVPVTLGDLVTLRDSGALSGLGGFRVVGGTLVDPAAGATRVSVAAVTSEVFPLLGVQPVLGRIPSPEEGPTILLGHRLWQEVYQEDPGILGRVVSFAGEPRTVSGVLPEGFAFPFNQDAWVGLAERATDTVPVEVVGRLAAGASQEAAEVDLAGRWSREDVLREPGERGGVLEVGPFTRGRGESGEGMAFLALVLVALALLLIACSNVANLLLVRATERVRFLAVQSALGADRVQIGAQLLLEAFLIALLGGLGGLLLAWVGVDAIQKRLAAEHFGYFWMRMAVDGRVLGFTTCLVAGTALFAGTLPVIRILRADLQSVLKEGGAGAVVGGGGRWSRGFVSLQLALSCAALVAAGLTGRSLARVRDFGRGLPGDEILVASMGTGAEAGVSSAERTARLEEVESRLGGLRGVRSAALALGGPGYMERWSSMEIGGRPPQRPQDRPRVLWNAVSPGYFAVLGLGVEEGRGLEDADGEGALPVAVVNEAFVRRFSLGEEALGTRVRIAGADSAAWFTIAGVVEDVDLGGGPGLPRDRVYLSLSQVAAQDVMLLVRAGPNPLSLAPEVRRAVADVDRELPVWSMRTLADAHAYMIRVPRAMSALALGGGLAGLLVAGVGLYGLLAFRVRQRRREMGVRLAVGADGRRLAQEILGVALRQLLPAMGAGLLVAWIAAPILGLILVGSDPRSPTTFVGVAVTFLAVGIMAALVPARRAARINPVDVLRGG